MTIKNKLQEKISESVQFLKADIWRLRADKLKPQKAFWITQLRIFLLAIRRFYADKCELRASALTFYSLLSIVPVVAMAFGVAQGFGLEKMLEAQVLASLEGQPEVADRILGFARTLLENTKGGAIAGVGVVVLFWTVVKVLGNIENSFNDIWGIKKARSLERKLADYLSVMMISPVLLITASSVTVLLTTQIASMVERLSFLGNAATIIVFVLRLLPYAVIWVLFTFMYAFMPNTKVQLKSALFGGIVAGTLYQFTQFAYIRFQIGVSSYGAIYGSFAALPLFLAWLQLSWLIVLLGAEASFAHQNVATYEFEQDCLTVNPRFKRMTALAVMALCVKKFAQAEKPSTDREIAQNIEVPIRLVRSVISDLAEARLLSEVCGNRLDDIAYQPACDIQCLTIAEINERLDTQGLGAVPIVESLEVQKLRETLKQFQEINEQSPANMKLR